MEQLGELQGVQQEIESLGVKVVAMSADTAADTADWLAFARLPFPLLSDPRCEVIQQFGVYDRLHDMALPSVLLIDPAGNVVWKHVGTSVDDRPLMEQVVREVRAYTGGRAKDIAQRASASQRDPS
ncbi:MAG: peroxiredoxin family protein [Planctomycetota bacterium]|jgi:peroxiredoxin